MATLKAVFQDPLVLEPSDTLITALHAAFRGGDKVRGIAIELAAMSETALPFEPLLELATLPREPYEAEPVGRAIAAHSTDAALAAILEVFHAMTPKEFWTSGAAIGHALRRTSHPKATTRLLELAQQATRDRLPMIAWTLARRPHSEAIAAYAKTLWDTVPELGGFLLFAHGHDHELAPVLQQMLCGEIRIGGAITISDRGPGIAQMKHAQDLAIAGRVDAISAYFGSLVPVALAGNRAARVRIAQLSGWLAAMSSARLPPSSGWMPPLATLIATADAKLAESGIDIFKLLAMPAAEAEAILRAIVIRSHDLGAIVDAKLTPKILANAAHHLDLELLARAAKSTVAGAVTG